MSKTRSCPRFHLATCLWVVAVLATDAAVGGRTDRDWIEPVEQRILIESPSNLEPLEPKRDAGPGAPSNSPKGGFDPAELTIATRDEARVFLQGMIDPRGASGQSTTPTVMALLERWREPIALQPDASGRAMPGLYSYRDCALFTAAAEARKAVIAGSGRKPQDSLGLGAALQLDIPIRCTTLTAPKASAPGTTFSLPSEPSRSAELRGSNFHRFAVVLWNEERWLLWAAGAFAIVLLWVVPHLITILHRRYARGDVLVVKPLE